MTPSPQTDRERAEDEAAAWLVLLSEEPADADLRGRFEAWRQACELNADIWARTSRAYDLVGKGTPHHREHWVSYAAERRPERTLPSAGIHWVSARPSPFPRPPLIRRRLAIAAGVAGLTALAALLLPDLALRMQADAMTGTADMRTLTLADGSRVSLAPESAIDVSFSGQRRRVRLLKGEAFFEVIHDASRPFSVTTGDVVATDLGTRFDVRRDEDGAVVAVQQGRVRVDGNRTIPPLSEDLHAGDRVRVTRQGTVIRSVAQSEDIADWRYGRLIARNQPATAVVDALRRYYPGVILIRDDAFASRLVSGIYDLNQPEQTLRELAASHEAAVRRISPWLLVVSGKQASIE